MQKNMLAMGTVSRQIIFLMLYWQSKRLIAQYNKDAQELFDPWFQNCCGLRNALTEAERQRTNPDFKYNWPKPDQLMKIANALGISINVDMFIQKIKDDQAEVAKLAIKQFGSVEKDCLICRLTHDIERNGRLFSQIAARREHFSFYVIFYK